MIKVSTKALSVNNAWKGRRFRTDDYKLYSQIVTLLLPKKIQVPSSPIFLYLEFGHSNKAFDFDNGIKPFVDILQQKYQFNDKDIKLSLISVNNDIKKGEDYIIFAIEPVSSSLDLIIKIVKTQIKRWLNVKSN